MKKFKVSVVGEPEQIKPVQSSMNAVSFFREKWQDMEMRESMHAIFLSKRNNILRHEVVSVGGVSGTICDPRIVFSFALTTPTCTGIILAHNHPSGNIKPSQQDTEITKKIKAGGVLLDLQLLDHVILTPADGYFSFADEGMI